MGLLSEAAAVHPRRRQALRRVLRRARATQAAGWVPPMDLVEAEDHFVLKADLPGLSDDDVSIEVQDGTLTISGERGAEQESHEERLVPDRALLRELQALADPAGGRRRRGDLGALRARRARGADTEARGAQAAPSCDQHRVGCDGAGLVEASTSIVASCPRRLGGRGALRDHRPRRRRPRGRHPHAPRRRAHAGVRAARLDGDGQVAARRRGRRARLRHGARQHLPPVHPARARPGRARWAACTSSWAGAARSSPTRAATRCSRWGTARWPRRSSGGASARKSMILSIEEEGVRFRSYLDGAERFMGPETSMEVQAALGSDIALAFDECTPFHVERDYTAALDGAHPPLARPLRRPGTASTRRRASCCTASCRAASTRTCARESTAYVAESGVQGIAIGGSLGQTKEQMREVVGWSLRDLPDEPPRHLLGIGDVDDLVHAVGAGHRHLRLRHARRAWPGTAPRSSHDPAAPLAARPDQGRAPHQQRADRRALPLPGLPRAHARLPALPDPGRRADRRSGCSPCTT